MRHIFDWFVRNCQKHYSVAEYVTIDEKLEAFRGRCPFKVYLPFKPAKYGIKVYALVDAKMFYTLNLEVYTGKQPTGSPYLVSNSPIDAVDRLVTPISKTSRNVTTDNWFTSYPLAEKLLSEHRLTLVGTMRKNKPQIPPEFLSCKGRPVHSTMFAFQKEKTVVSHIPRKGKLLFLLSTMHHDDSVDETTDDQQQPEINTFYNATKGGVDVVDEFSAPYDVSRNSQGWPLTLFFAIINVTVINAQIIYDANTKVKHERRVFFKELGLSLIKPQIDTRNCDRLPGFNSEETEKSRHT